jgi:hypothetical protein
VNSNGLMGRLRLICHDLPIGRLQLQKDSVGRLHMSPFSMRSSSMAHHGSFFMVAQNPENVWLSHAG